MDETTSNTDEGRVARPPVLTRELCLRDKTARASCERCSAVCPEDAIAFEDRLPVIDQTRCIACDLCCAVCPTSAFGAVAANMNLLLPAIGEAAQLYGCAYLVCAQAGVSEEAGCLIEVPCLGAFPPEFWFCALAENERMALFLPDGLCGSCPCSEGELLMSDAVSKAEAWSEKTMGLITKRADLNEAIDLSASEGLDRRDFFENIAKAAGQTLRAGNVHSAAAQMNRQRKRLKSAHTAMKRVKEQRDAAFAEARETGVFKMRSSILAPPRVLLQNALPEHPELASNVSIETSYTAPTCIGCGECAKLCPTGARSIEDGKAVVDDLYCVGCGLCETLCPAGACEPITMSADGLFEEE